MKLRQKLPLFPYIFFCMNILLGMVKEDILTTYFGSNWSRVTNRIAEHQPKELVNQNNDLYERRRRGIFLIIFNTPVMPVDTTKLN